MKITRQMLCDKIGAMAREVGSAGLHREAAPLCFLAGVLATDKGFEIAEKRMCEMSIEHMEAIGSVPMGSGFYRAPRVASEQMSDPK